MVITFRRDPSWLFFRERVTFAMKTKSNASASEISPASEVLTKGGTAD